MNHPNNSQRRYDLDWLRIVGIGIVFLSHCFLIFVSGHCFVTNNETSKILYFVDSFFILWIMPLFFIISGRTVYYSIKTLKVTNFLKNRFYRLMIPFIFGVFILSPVIVYIQRISEGAYFGTFFDFFTKEYFRGLYLFGGNFAWMGLHLWYLLYLFIFTLIAILPACYLLKKRDRPLFYNLTNFLQKPATIFLLSIPIMLAIFISRLEPTIMGQTATGGWSFLAYSVFFSYGFIFTYDSRYDKIIDDNWKISAVLAAVLIVVYFWIIADYQLFLKINPIIISFIVGLSSFSILITLFGLFHLKLRKKSITLEKMTEGVLPFYILHLPIIVIVGFFITRLNYGVFVKLTMIIIISLSLTISIYYFLIKRINFLRLLFGMKLKK
ncbi:MAG TPA: acyltransferase [Candidatus Lokiarchaeia archaeon]